MNLADYQTKAFEIIVEARAQLQDCLGRTIKEFDDWDGASGSELEIISINLNRWKKRTIKKLLTVFEESDVNEFRKLVFDESMDHRSNLDVRRGLRTCLAYLDAMDNEVFLHPETLFPIDHTEPVNMPTKSDPNLIDVFLVHGRDEAAREGVARFLENLGLKAIILHEQSSQGLPLSSKLAHYSDVDFAVVLLTPDDVGRLKGDPVEKPRARQNVVFELGYFIAKLGPAKVCALVKDDIERPSDYDAVYVVLDSHGGWKTKLFAELKAAGFKIEWKS